MVIESGFLRYIYIQNDFINFRELQNIKYVIMEIRRDGYLERLIAQLSNGPGWLTQQR